MSLGAKRGAESLILKGKCKWANRLFIPDIEYKKWSLVLYPDTDSLEKIRDLQAEGMKNVLKKDEDGYHVAFSRPTEKVIRGKVVAFDPPTIVDFQEQPFAGPIGNGSDVTVKLEVYQHSVPGTQKKAKAARVMSVRVDNLVPFEKEKDFTDTEKENVDGLDQHPVTF